MLFSICFDFFIEKEIKTMTIIYIKSTAEFMKIRSRPMIVKYGAKWCGPCKAIAPVYERISNDPRYKQLLTFVVIDIEVTPDLATLYSVSAVPTFQAFKNGRIVDQFTGASEERLKKMARMMFE
jgi:thiol-disulfide isomerase/thioredoxin